MTHDRRGTSASELCESRHPLRHPRWTSTTLDNTAAFTAYAALDPSTPRFLHIAGDRISARELAAVISEVTGKQFRLFRGGGLGMLGMLIKVARTLAPGEEELYPAWQGMQYMRNMFKVLFARYYRRTYHGILKRLCSGSVLYVDETEVRLRTGRAYVWVFASVEDVAYVYRPTREGHFTREYAAVMVATFDQEIMNPDLRRWAFEGYTRNQAAQSEKYSHEDPLCVCQ